VIPNMSDVAKALNRPPEYPTKYFGCELGTMVKCDEAVDKYLVNGAHDANKLQDILDGFIQKFVLCQECGNPETDLIITKDGEIWKGCKGMRFSNGFIISLREEDFG
jgi:translation initiation factor 5